MTIENEISRKTFLDITEDDLLGAPVPVHTHADNTQGGNTLTVPTIADFTNAQHDHQSAAKGGAIPDYVGATLSVNGTPGLVPAALFGVGRNQVLLGNGGWATMSGDATIDGSGIVTVAGKQPLDTELTALASTTSAADKLPYFTGAGTATTTDLTSFARTILDDTTAAAVRATIGAGTGSGDALTSQPLSQFAATTSAQLAGVLSDETGSGKAVFGTNPVFASYDDFTSITDPANPASGTARVYSRGYGTSLDWLVAIDAGNALQLGQDVTFIGRKATVGTIGGLKAVAASTAGSSMISVTTAKADAASTMPCVGITMGAIGGSGGQGRVMAFGRIYNADTSAFSAGDLLYVSAATAGALTATAPASPNIIQRVGIVLVSSATVGELFVNVGMAEPDGLMTQFIANTISLGDGTAGAKNVAFRASGTGTLAWTPTGSRTLTLPDATDTVVGKATTDTLTNKTLTTPTIGDLTNMTHIHTGASSGGNLFAADGGTTANTAVQGSDNRIPPGVEAQERYMRSILPNELASTITPTANKAYAVFLGRTKVTCTPKFVRFVVSAGGAGAQTAECGFFSSPTAPSKANQTLTKLVATGTVDALTGTGLMGNTSAFSTSVAAGTYLWAVLRITMALTQPTCYGLSFDLGQGYVLTATPGALTGITSMSGVLVASSAVAVSPDLSGSLD